MIFRANTTITILSKDSELDEWGDPMDSSAIVQTRIPASITETGTSDYSENSTRPRVIRNAICRVSTAYAGMISNNNRIKDEQTQETWIILSVTRPNNAVGHVPMHIVLQRAD